MAMMKSQKLIDYEAWIEAWHREHPLPPMSKKARWRIANAAWLEWRRQVRKAERESAKEARLSSLSLGARGVERKI